MIEKFKTLFFVKSSLITLYLALTFPIPFVSDKESKIFSIIAFLFGLILILSITSDYVKTSDKKIYYRSSFFSKFFGKKDWEIFWKDIKKIKSFPTSQGSKVFYFITTKEESFLVPQRIENFDKFASIISTRTNLKLDDLSYISPLWTYKLLTYISSAMIVGEIATLFT